MGNTNKKKSSHRCLVPFLWFLGITVPIFAATVDETPKSWVDVELRSGVHQTAQLIAEDSDSVTLGGTVQGEFKTVRIARNQILSLQPLPEAPTPISDTSSTNRPLTTRDWKNALLMLPLESDLDSAQTHLWTALLEKLLREKQGPRLQSVTFADFDKCDNLDCIIQTARSEGAKGIFTGKIRSLKDSTDVRLRIQWLQGNRLAVSESRHRIPAGFEALLQAGVLPQMLAEVTGSKPPKPKKTKSWVLVETDPEGATLSVDNESPVCKSPCTFARSDTGSINIHAFWRVEDNLWGGQGTTRLIGGDTAKVYLKLRRTGTLAEIRSEPSGAEVLPPSPLEAQTRALGKTPYLLYDRDPGEIQVRLWSPGYRDTLVSLRIDPMEKTVIAPRLTALTDPAELALQKSLIRHRQHRKIGFALLGSSAAPFLIGTTFIVLAQSDYDKARAIRKELAEPSSGSGPGFQSKVDENHLYADRGDTKLYSGIGLIGISVLLASTGFVLVF